MRRYQTGMLLFCDKAPIIWFGNRQNCVEASTFGSEFTGINNTVEIIEDLRYKLSMFGVPINGLTDIFCDNRTVCANTTQPESNLTKKHISITYHRKGESVASGTFILSKEHTSKNFSDVFTRTMGSTRRDNLLDLFTY